MKKIIFSFFLLFSFFIYSQNQGTITLEWSNSKYSISEDNTIETPWFKSNEFVYNDRDNSIMFIKNIPTLGPIEPNSLKIFDVNYETISADKVRNLKNIPTSLETNLNYTNARDDYYAIINVSPIINENGNYKKITSFSYSFSNSVNNRENIANKAGIINSVLKSGEWKRFFIQKSGVYKISKAFLQQLGFNVNVDPRTIKIYGNGGRMLPLLNSIPYPDDLIENAISFAGEQDGVFNDNDYILFYGEGVDNWNNESQTSVNLYADKTYYYITSSPTNSKRITPLTEPSGAPTSIFTTFDNTQFYEVDKNNIAKLGRKWVGDPFNIQSDQSFIFDLPNLDTSQLLNVEVEAIGASIAGTSMSVICNNQNLGNLNFFPIVPGGLFASEASLTRNFNSSSSGVNILLKYNNSGVPTSNAYLDYIRLAGKCFLKGYGKQFKFQIDNASSLTGIGTYQFSNATSINEIWDITDIYNVSSKINPGQSNFEIKSNLGTASKFLALDINDLYSPSYDTSSNVVNQDLKGTIFLNNQNVFQDVDYLIVTPSIFVSQAEKLANFHRQKSNLNVKVVTLDKIYQEFSSGKQDIGAIRNFVKYIYNNASSASKKIQYLCLFGDASFDYKDRIPNNTNITPTFESLYSYSLVSSFVSDDYFVLMDNNEGDMNSFQGLDLAVGRILASNSIQADQMVNKIIFYYDQNSLGKWKSNITMISDDVDKESDISLEVDMNNMADLISGNKPFFNVKKILADSYVQETTSGGEKYPKVNEDFTNSFQLGSLVVNYLGHGGEDGLAQERIFEKNDAISLNNLYKFPLFITVTCEFTRFDNPFKPTAGEYVYWNPSGGAIAMVTTTRQIGQSTGTLFNFELNRNLYSFGSNNYTSIAEAVRKSKNNSSSTGNNVVTFLGDPAMKLAIPKPKIILTKINDIPIASSTDNLQALSLVKLSGEVVDENNVLLNNYNGDVSVNIYDKTLTKSTLGNNNIMQGGTVFKMNFNTLGEIIFRGNASVSNGKFDITFMVPRDIQIPLGNGKVSFYAKNNSVTEDQIGYNTDIKVGGLNPNPVADTTSPRVRIYMNNESFVSGGITNQSPIFLAFLEDEHGINTASGIGHDIIAFLDGDETKPIVLNDYYETELNNYTKGKLKYPFKNLSIGLHTLTFKAWDVYNNLVKAELQFVVAGDEDITLSNVLNYPNPFVNHTEFWFNHNRPFEPLEVQVQVMTITGKIVWSKNQTISNDGFLSRDITWDGRDDFGDRIGKGVYIYKLTVKSTLTNKKSEKFEKLVIL